MAARKFILDEIDAPRKPAATATRERIEAALVQLMAEGAMPNHDAVAARAGVSRRTVYRYFPDQPALHDAVWQQLSPTGAIPQTVDQLVGRLPYVFRAFDRNAEAMTVLLSTGEGRAIRNAKTPQRVEAYRAALAPAVEALPESDRTRATAILQLLSDALAWRELREQWAMDGADMAVAVRWALETLLADLAARGGRPLDIEAA